MAYLFFLEMTSYITNIVHLHQILGLFRLVCQLSVIFGSKPVLQSIKVSYSIINVSYSIINDDRVRQMDNQQYKMLIKKSVSDSSFIYFKEKQANHQKGSLLEHEDLTEPNNI